MKFGEYLKENILNPWRFEYIQYDLLKQDLKQRQLDHEWNERDEADFWQLFSNEQNKISKFVCNFNQQLISRIQYAQHLLESSINNHQTTNQRQQQSVEFLSTLDNSLMEIIFDVYDFAKFIQLNKLGLAKILKKHKKWTLIDHISMSRYEHQPIDLILNSNWDTSFYTQASLLRLQCQQKLNNSNPKINDIVISEREIPATSSERRIKKYWIHPDHVSEVTAIISLHAFALEPLTKLTYKDHQKEFDFSMSNVYFENSGFDAYSKRVACIENAQTIKCKRYGSVSNNDDNTNTVFFENEEYNKAYSCDISSKRRFKLEHHLLDAFCKGECNTGRSSTPIMTDDMDEKEAMHLYEEKNNETLDKVFANETQKDITMSSLVPIIQCDYQRVSFQSTSQDRAEKATITLDTDIRFTAIQHKKDGDRNEKEEGTFFFVSNDNEHEQKLFPYAVLEIKLPSDVKKEDFSLNWLNLFTTKSKLAHEIPKFSKYLQGVHQLCSLDYPSLASPEWVEVYDKSISKSIGYTSGLSRSRSLRPLINGKSFICSTLYSDSPANISTEDNYRKSLQQKKASIKSFSSYHSISNSDEFTAISINDRSFKKKAVMGAPVNEDDYKVVLDMNEKTEMNYFEHPIPNKSSSFFPNFLKKSNRNDSRLNILDEDGNPIEYTNQQIPSRQKKNKPLVIKIEPKVFFANERTFISWLQFCALLLTVALNLLNFGDQVSKICGGIFLFISMLLALYALARFQYRAWQLRHPNQTGRFDDLYGPAVLCILIVAALVINFWLRFRHITEPEQQGLYPSS